MTNPDANRCTITLELPWDVAELLVKHWSEILAPIQAAVAARRPVVAERAEQRAILDQRCNATIAAWRELAAKCETEIARRANTSGQQRAIIRQLAAEHGLSPSLLRSIIKVHGSRRRNSIFKSRPT